MADRTLAPRGAPARPAVSRPRPTPPVRPAVSGSRSFSTSRGATTRPSMPTVLAVSIGLWFAACFAGLFGVAAAVADIDRLRSRLTDTARAVDATATSAALDEAVGMTILLVLGAVVVVVLLAVVGAVLVHHRRSWARWALLATGLITLVVVDVAQSTVSGGNELDRIALAAQAGLVVLALVPLFARSSRRWLRGSDD